ncbi:MAG: L-aspartate oxidase [Deltaproteobacteria bacterium]|nr:L-aspartate oxidase [Deltaproteobacteria bacterium]
MVHSSDFLVIGSGIAGLTFALKAAETGNVTLITKRGSKDSATYYAQGGIASVLSKDDSFESHIKDTLATGLGLSDPDIVEMVVRDGPEMIHDLIEIGVRFSSTLRSGHMELDLGKEGGHSQRRIVHAGDLTGQEIENALISAVKANKNITLLEEHIAVDLITHTKFIGKGEEEAVWGAYVLDKKNGEIHTFAAKATIIASGGAGKVYLYTSNPDISTGDGIAMAFRAGAEIRNMEFIQFHPTCLYHSKAKSFLISEALRGEGAVLKLKNGEPFMKQYHPMADLAPRDIVARAIDHELKKSGDDCVYLDISAKDKTFIIERFPNIHKKCLEFGFDLTKEPIPVVPAAHYTCGGVRTDKDGRTNIKRLYCIGESAHTGLHGANRLASNSLLESLVFAKRAAIDSSRLIKDTANAALPELPEWKSGEARVSNEAVVISQNWDEIRRLMWNYVGIVRSAKRLEMALSRIELLGDEINDYYWHFTVTSDLIELRNIATVAEIIIKSAMQRKESRGLHYNIDYPDTNNAEFGHDTIIRRKTNTAV